MKLINVKTHVIVDFLGHEVPRYAILSHTWGEGEVTFGDMREPYTAREMKGFTKIERSCQRAAADGLQWIWIDTCCIDKASSAELSESINSMFEWYGRADICYAYLSDLEWNEQGATQLLASRWFTRGWTLQELIAPYKVVFYDRDWRLITTKRKARESISAATRISRGILDHSVALSSIPVAEKMKWAADRQTTRLEDRAYSLLGIFGVHMPLLYGEEGRAFVRLQEEILKQTEDYTLLLWGTLFLPQHASPRLAGARDIEGDLLEANEGQDPLCNPLARSPDDFKRVFNVDRLRPYRGRYTERGHTARGQPPQVTSRGLKMSLFISQVTDLEGVDGQLWKKDISAYLGLLSNMGHEHFARSISPNTASASRLFVAALQCNWRIVSGSPFPCILLLRTSADTQPQHEAEFVKLRWFASLVYRREVEESWSMTECFLRSANDISTLRRELCLDLRQPAHFSEEVQWRQRDPAWDLKEGSVTISQSMAEARFSCQLVGGDDARRLVSIFCSAMTTKVFARAELHGVDGVVRSVNPMISHFHETGIEMFPEAEWVKCGKRSGIVLQTSISIDDGERELEVSIISKESGGQQLFEVILSFDEPYSLQYEDTEERQVPLILKRYFGLEGLKLILCDQAEW